MRGLKISARSHRVRRAGRGTTTAFFGRSSSADASHSARSGLNGVSSGQGSRSPWSARNLCTRSVEVMARSPIGGRLIRLVSSRRRLAGSEVQAWSKGASSLAACGNMQQASGVYTETLWRMHTRPRGYVAEDQRRGSPLMASPLGSRLSPGLVEY